MSDEAWLSALFEEHYELLYRVGRLFCGNGQTAMVEEQIQEVFLLAWQKRGKLRHHPNPGGWLVEAMRLKLMNSGRKLARENRHRAFSLDEQDTGEMEDAGCVRPEDFLRDGERRALLIELLGREDAELFWRYCVRGESAEELSGRCGISVNAVRMRICRIRKRLVKNREMFYAIVLMLVLFPGGR